MKYHPARILPASLFVIVLAYTSPAWAQRHPEGRGNGPASKIYVAEAKGESRIQTGGKVYTARQATAFDASGTVIETKEESHNAFVYSNGTGMYVNQNSRVEINRFIQEPFTPDRNTDVLVEPSISQSIVRVVRGAIGICTNKLVSGSSMTYTTPHGTINVRGGRFAIESNSDETVIDLLEGDLTVRGGSLDGGGRVLHAGERAVIRSTGAGGQATVTVGPIPPEALEADEHRVGIACNARRTVSFEVIGNRAADGPDGATATFADGATQEIVARPTVPRQLPSNIVISPDRLPGT